MRLEVWNWKHQNLKINRFERGKTINSKINFTTEHFEVINVEAVWGVDQDALVKMIFGTMNTNIGRISLETVGDYLQQFNIWPITPISLPLSPITSRLLSSEKIYFQIVSEVTKKTVLSSQKRHFKDLLRLLEPMHSVHSENNEDLTYSIKS